jgi:uncharacterized protein (DUF2252 family)
MSAAKKRSHPELAAATKPPKGGKSTKPKAGKGAATATAGKPDKATKPAKPAKPTAAATTTGAAAAKPWSARQVARERGVSPFKGSVQRPERAAEGKAVRGRVPRAVHGEWEPHADRPDPIAILEQQAASRVPELIPIRHGRMAASAFGFYRGAAAVMAWDLSQTPDSGFTVQACGDAHLVNFGIFASPERHLIFDVNDFDETLPAPWEWDVKRLAASIVVAGRENGFGAEENDLAVRTAVGTYRERMFELATMRTLDVWYSRVDVDEILTMFEAMSSQSESMRTAQKTVARARNHDTMHAVAKLTEVVDGVRRIADHPPLIDHVALANAEDQIRSLYEGYLASLSPELQLLLNRFHLVDVARKVVGVGSVGTRCWIALFEGGADDDPLLLQIKEAQTSVLEHELHVGSIYRHHGERVVHGQRLVQAASDLFLGWSTNPATGVHYYWRQLHDMKGSADVPSMSSIQLANYARICGWALARAHARSGDASAISGYLGRGAEFDRAVATFAQRYADQNERDYEAMLAAVASGRIEAEAGI